MMKPFTMESLEKALCEKLAVNFGKQPEEASNQEMLRCCALVLRDVMSVRGVAARREAPGKAPGPLPVPGVSDGAEPHEKRL